MKRNTNKGEKEENIKYLVLGICVAFVLLGVFAGVGVSVASATTWHVDDDLVDYPRCQLHLNSGCCGCRQPR